MARGRKMEALTPEERLQAALVPESEQPYKVPGNWCWVYLQTLCEIPITDGTHKTPKYSDKENGIPFVSAKDVTKGYIDWSNIKYITKELHEELYQRLAPQIDDVLLAKNGTTGVAALVVDNYIFDLYVTLAVLRPNKKLISPRYLYYLVNSPVAKIQFDTHLTGIGVPNLHLRDIKITSFPLPPLPEQQRIVGRMESLFAKLDEAKQRAQDALDSFETRKAAILHKAFTGELTAQWRKEHGMGMESWKIKKLSEVSTLQTGLMKGKKYSGKTVVLPYLRVANVQDGFLNLSEIKKIEVSEVLIDRYSLKNGDVLFTEGGDYDKLGRGTVWQGQIKNCLHQNHVFVVRPQADVLSPYFLSYQAGSRYGKQYFLKCSKQTTNLASINSTQLKGFPVLMPTIEEQAQIVLLIDDLLAKEQQAKEAAEGVLDQIDLIKKAILARAFRGELGTNDPSEESAVELLKQIL